LGLPGAHGDDVEARESVAVRVLQPAAVFEVGHIVYREYELRLADALRADEVIYKVSRAAVDGVLLGHALVVIGHPSLGAARAHALVELPVLFKGRGGGEEDAVVVDEPLGVGVERRGGGPAAG